MLHAWGRAVHIVGPRGPILDVGHLGWMAGVGEEVAGHPRCLLGMSLSPEPPVPWGSRRGPGG